jgi:hypothetical protein
MKRKKRVFADSLSDLIRADPFFPLRPGSIFYVAFAPSFYLIASIRSSATFAQAAVSASTMI